MVHRLVLISHYIEPWASQANFAVSEEKSWQAGMDHDLAFTIDPGDRAVVVRHRFVLLERSGPCV
jgi:hypothetical protein